MRVIKQLLSWLMIFAIGIFPLATPLLAGQSDVDLFAGGGRLPPNMFIMLDSSGSMLSEPSTGGGVSKRDIAIDSIVALIEGVNPPTGGGSYTENALFGIMTFRDDGGTLQRQIETGNTQATISAVQNHQRTFVGTPLSGAILDVARYFAANESWGTLAPWGTRSGEANVRNVWDFSCRDSFTIFISDGNPSSDRLQMGGYWNTIGDYDGDAGAGEGGAENAGSVGSSNIEWTDDITKAMFERDFSSALEGRQKVVTHVIGFDTNGDNLQRMADAGGGLYRTPTTAAGCAAALRERTQASFGSLASYSTAVVPTSRTAFGSSFYNAFFNPLADEPFWEGHIEAFDLSPEGVILDAAGNPAVDPVTDELYEPHNPHWDAGVRLRSNTSRTLYTTLAGVTEDFSPGAGVEAALGIVAGDVGLFPNAALSGITTTAQAEVAVINYLTGEDAFDEDNDGDYSELRATVLGDIFHSTPVIVGPPTTLLTNESGYNDFLTAWAGRQRILYSGANDAMFHAFDAGSITIGDNPLTPAVETTAVYYTSGTGDEVFGYVPGLLLDVAKYVPLNDPRTYYSVDGSPVVADVWLRSNSTDYTRETDEWT
ncbi:MAG: hypothetical protein JRJ58_15450, partial [Deltaproteobacteria bacterium]|nr:hypothetical protein [Deltaproteobacteria bacterium]